jgi:hypothetical protein
MSRKHFKALAGAIAGIKDSEERKRMCEAVGAVCAGCNDHFNWSTWRSACGVEG